MPRQPAHRRAVARVLAQREPARLRRLGARFVEEVADGTDLVGIRTDVSCDERKFVAWAMYFLADSIDKFASAASRMFGGVAVDVPNI